VSNVTIISDGTSAGTKVQIDDTFMKGITNIEILPIKANATIKAIITVDACSLRMSIKDAEILQESNGA
jgi:hypothetical protein